MGELARRVVSSPSIATWGSFSARALPLIVLPGFVFSSFSEEKAALWFILITIQGLQLLVESNVGLTFIRAIGFAMGGASHLGNHASSGTSASTESRPNLVLLAEVWGAMRYCYLGVALLSLLLLGGAAAFSSEAIIKGLDDPLEGVLPVCIFVICAALRSYGGLHISYLYGVGRIARMRWWECLFWICSFSLSLIALLLEFSLTAVVIFYQAPLVINLLINVLLCRQDEVYKTQPRAEKGRPEQVLIELWPLMWRSALGVIIYLGVIQGAGLVYARFGEPREVAIYLFAMSLMRPMMQFAQVPFFTKLPLIAAFQVSGRRGELLDVARKSMQATYILLASMIVLMGVAFPILSEASEFFTPVPQSLWSLIGLASIVERVGAMHLQLYSQTNHIVWHWANGGAAVVFVVAALYLLPAYQAEALPLAMLVASLVFYIPYCRYHSFKAYALGWRFDLDTAAAPIAAVVALNFVYFLV
jgi:O-antigen/teichoic acid export membrane protein